ncbi:CerR family C-terminal domain-containing protein [Reyranella sp.]|jgi:AcrR family transcriptional regulator|uniref:CerR family C-terminal domain-containing protein n=1 Tax=Reyranella sp. TaxID=1929291 RepID=UPI002F931051
MTHSTLRQRSGAYARGEDTRRRILETALEIFAAEGYEGASTRHLAERAGVNLPAIQYYFGSKEGLYRAVIEHIVQHNEAHMAPLAVKVRAALAHPDTAAEELLELLCEMLEAFVALISGGRQNESRRLLYARAEIERTAGLELLHKTGMRQIFEPCLALVARLLGRSTEDQAIVLRTVALIGQVTIFCNRGVREALGLDLFSEERVRAVQALVRSHSKAIMRDAMAASCRTESPDGH